MTKRHYITIPLMPPIDGVTAAMEFDPLASKMMEANPKGIWKKGSQRVYFDMLDNDRKAFFSHDEYSIKVETENEEEANLIARQIMEMVR